MRRSVFLIAVLLLPASWLRADVITADFEGLNDGDFVSNQIAGLIFSNAIVLSQGVSLNEFEFPPHSGNNVVSDASGPITILFSGPAISVDGFFTYGAMLTLSAYDASNNLEATAQSQFSQNFVSSGGTPNEEISLDFAGGFSKLVITGDPGGGSFTLDDLTVTTQAAVSSVPEPSSIAAIAAAVGLLALRKKSAARLSIFSSKDEPERAR